MAGDQFPAFDLNVRLEEDDDGNLPFDLNVPTLEDPNNNGNVSFVTHFAISFLWYLNVPN